MTPLARPASLALILLAAFTLVSCRSTQDSGAAGPPRSIMGALHSPGPRSPDDPPPVMREFRAAWVATVGNIDWPSKPGLSTDEQKREAVAILDRAAEMNLNAIVFQVR